MDGEFPLVVVEDTESLEQIAESLSQQAVIALDTESDSFYHYKERVCLIQLSDTKRDIIVDPLKISDLSSLAPILENPLQVKVLHGADYDIVCLKRDFGFRIRGLFDTMMAARFLEIPRIGLGDLVHEVFGFSLEKKYQRHDWSMRPLREEHLEYARNDTHWLIPLREVLIRRLERSGWLDAVLEESMLMENREWTGKANEPGDFLRLRGSSLLEPRGQHILWHLYEYREAVARRLNRPVFKVIPDSVMVDIARNAPTSNNALDRLMRPNSPMRRIHGRALLKAVEQGLRDDRPLPSPPTRRKKPKNNNAGSQWVAENLKQWRKKKTAQEGMSAVFLPNNALLREIAKKTPTTIEELSDVPGIRKWQLATFGDEVVRIVGEALRMRSVSTKTTRKRRRHG